MNSPNNYNRFSFFKKIIYSLLFIGIQKICAFGQEINPDGYNIFYYDNGQIASEGSFKNNLPEGLWKTYYPDGILKSQGYKSVGQSDSTWFFYDNTGRLTWRYEYDFDKKNGCAQRFDTLNNLREELFYVNDVIQGEKIWLYPDGSLKKTLTYFDGKEVGVSLEFSKEGTIITEEIYDNGYLKDRAEYNRLDKDGKKTGTWRDYYANGKIKSETEFKEGQMNGLTKSFNLKGKLVEIATMTSDTSMAPNDVVLIELYKEYYEDGRVKLIGGLNNGMKNGIFRSYDEAGNLLNGFIYEKDTMTSEGMILFNGTYSGSWLNFYKSGKKRSQGVYTNGIKEGLWTYFYENGKKEQEGNYKNDTPIGVWTWYYPNGKLKRTENFNGYGKLEGLVKEYDSLGAQITSGEYYNGLQEGPWFYEVGDHKEVGTYTVGQPDGIWRHYYKNGKLAFVGTYDEGEPKGRHIYYHQNGIKKMDGKYLGGSKEGRWKTYNEMGEVTEEITYKQGEIFKINGFKVEDITKQ